MFIFLKTKESRKSKVVAVLNQAPHYEDLYLN